MNTIVNKLEKRIEKLEHAIREIYEANPQSIERAIKRAVKLLPMQWGDPWRPVDHAAEADIHSPLPKQITRKPLPKKRQ
jgi:hypothetical protein